MHAPDRLRDGDATLLVLLGLRLKGFAPADAIVEVVGLDHGRVHEELERSRAEGWVAFREGRLTGWSLTPAGRAEGQRRLAEELDASGCRPTVRAGYAGFLELNGEVLAICTDWQMREPSTPNDHSDPDYDATVIERLGGLHDRAQPICVDLADVLSRFEGYGARLGAALGRVRAGEHDWFTSVRLPSYHTVWFELHENLLATLGIERGRESR